MRALLAAAALAVLAAGCTCRLSGTPLDTMDKQLNPACWCMDDDEPAPAPTPAPDAQP